MTKDRLCSILVVTALVCSSMVSDILGEEGKETQPSEKVNFFQASAESDGIDILGAPSRMPDDGAVLSQEHYPFIVKQFIWWAKKLLKPEYLPDENYTKTYIKLLPAAKRNSKEDLAFLSYEISGKTYMIVQSGGWHARMWFFVRDVGRGLPRDTEDASRVTQTALDTFIHSEQRKRIPAFQTNKTNTLYVAEIRSGRTKELINRAKCYVGKNDLCIVLQKISYEDPEAATEPMPDQWFSWGKENK